MDTGKNFNAPQVSEEIIKEIQEKQKWYQARQAKIGFAHLIGKGDRLTSVLIPGAMALVGGGMAIRALHNLYTGTGKGDQ